MRRFCPLPLLLAQHSKLSLHGVSKRRPSEERWSKPDCRIQVAACPLLQPPLLRLIANVSVSAMLPFFYCIICRAARRANRRPGQRFIANNSNPIPYNKLNRSLPRFTGLPITGSPAAAGLVSTPAGAGAVVPPFIELHFHSPCIFIAGQRQNADANATRPQRQPTYVVSSCRATNVAATVDSFLANAGSACPCSIYFRLINQLSLRLCCHDVMSPGLSMQPPPLPTLNKHSIASIRGSNMLLDFQITWHTVTVLSFLVSTTALSVSLRDHS